MDKKWRSEKILQVFVIQKVVILYRMPVLISITQANGENGEIDEIQRNDDAMMTQRRITS
jgi:hypothetical protein